MKNKIILRAIGGILLSFSMISCVSTKAPVEKKIIDTYEVVKEKNKNGKYNIDAEYPQFDAPEFQKLNTAIEQCYKNDLNLFKSNADYSDFDLEFSFDFKYEVYSYKNLKSVLLTSWSYTGGAHGNTLLYSYCFDPFTQKFLTASEASGIPLSQIALRTRMELTGNPDLKDYITDDEWFMEGSAPTDENYRTFVMSDKGITVFFEPYQVAPYAVGVLQATLK